jgi:uncharacterized protein (DUF983 family)
MPSYVLLSPCHLIAKLPIEDCIQSPTNTRSRRYPTNLMLAAGARCRACFDPIEVGPLICNCKGDNAGIYCPGCQQLYFRCMFRKLSKLNHRCNVCKETFTFVKEGDGRKVFRGLSLLSILIPSICFLSLIIHILYTIRIPIMHSALAVARRQILTNVYVFIHR